MEQKGLTGWYRVEYLHETKEESDVDFIYIEESDLRNNSIEDLVKTFTRHNFHRYYGNHDRGHGHAVVKWSKVTRPDDESVKREIDYFEKEKSIVEGRLRKLYNSLESVEYSVIGASHTLSLS